MTDLQMETLHSYIRRREKMQKKLKALGLLLLVFTLTTAVGTTITAETAAAKKVKVKKLKLNKKKLTIKVGEKKTLKVTVKPKKAKLTWKSSKKKIATVSKKGVVKGKKKGTTKITVTSGKKKAVCKVKVNETYSIQSVQVINSKVVRVSLNKAKKLSASNFAITKRATANGKNDKKLSIAGITNSQEKTYDLVLATNYDAKSDVNYIDNGDYVQVAINNLNGVNQKETVYYESLIPENEYIGGVTEEAMQFNVYFNASYKGYLSDVKISGLPAGLTAVAYDHYVTIKGIPTAVANGKVATMTARDELGKSLTQRIYFYIGSENQIVSYIPFEGRTILANDEDSEYFRICAYGGSGSYNYTLLNNNNSYIENDESEIQFRGYRYSGNNKQYLPAGKYKVSYSVTDSDNAKIKSNGSLAVTAVNGVKITGKVVAADNSVLTGVNVIASLQDVNNAYYKDDLESYTEFENDASANKVRGYYNLTVYPSQTYTIVADGGEDVCRGVVNYSVGTSSQALNFVLPLYKVTFQVDGIDISDIVLPINGTEQSGWLAGDPVVYLRKGTYTINDISYVTTGTGFTAKNIYYKFTAKFTVNGNMSVHLLPVKVYESYEYDIGDTLPENKKYRVDAGEYYYFTPLEEGEYVFTTNENQWFIIYDMEGNELEESDELTGGTSYTTSVTLKKDTTYVIYFDRDSKVKASLYRPDAENEENLLEE